jgi:Fe-S cluster assembly protein SufD
MSVTTEIKKSTSEILSSLEMIATTPTRLQAKAAFERMGLPEGKSEEYRFAPITRILEKNFNLNESDQVKSSIQSITEFELPTVDAYKIVFINGEYSSTLSQINTSDFIIEPLDEEKHSQHLAKHADFKADALVAWNTAAWKNGIFIKVAANKVIEKPVIIYHIQDASHTPVKTINRILIEVERSSEITIIEKFDSIGTHPNFSNIVTEAVVGENAGLNLYSIQADHGNRHQFVQTTIWQSNHSRANTYTFTLDGKFVRNNLQLLLDGEGCESHMYGLYLLHGETLADNHTVVDHRKPNSFSNELYKGVLEGNSKGVFNGKIFVRPNAQKTNAFQSNRNILLSDKATVNTKPQLEIWADDVKCSHGCTTGQLDEEALFYLQSRGIDKNTARAMILYAFAAGVLDTIPNENLKQFIDGLISERLHKNF